MKLILTFEDVTNEQACAALRAIEDGSAIKKLTDSVSGSGDFEPDRNVVIKDTGPSPAKKSGSAKADSTKSGTKTVPPAETMSAKPTDTVRVAGQNSFSPPVIEDVRAALQGLQSRTDVNTVKNLLEKFGNPVLKKIPVEKYRDLINEANHFTGADWVG